MQFQLTAADEAAPAYLNVVVTTSGSSSPAVTLAVLNPVPVLSAPAAIAASSNAATLTLSGSGFLPSTVVSFGGSPCPTSFVSSTQVQVSLTAGDLTSGGRRIAAHAGQCELYGIDTRTKGRLLLGRGVYGVHPGGQQQHGVLRIHRALLHLGPGLGRAAGRQRIAHHRNERHTK